MTLKEKLKKKKPKVLQNYSPPIIVYPSIKIMIIIAVIKNNNNKK